MLSSVLGSSATNRVRLVDCEESEAKNELKLGNSSLRSCSCTFRAEATLSMEATSFDRSSGWVPVIAWVSTAPPRSDFGERS